MPTIAALFSVFVSVGVAIVLAGSTTTAVVVGAVLAVGGSAMGIKGWSDSAVPKSMKGWLGSIAICFGVGTAIYTVECIVGKLAHPELSFLEAGLRTGPFGGICTVVVTGWLLLFMIGGAAYRGTESWMRRKALGSR